MINKLLLLGIPIDRVSHENLEETLLYLIESHHQDKMTKFATSITGLFLGKLSGFILNQRTMPQVVASLRNADFIGINSKELQLLSKLLGNQIHSLIRPEDLLLAAASLLAKHRRSIFLLGGNEELCKLAKDALLLEFPGLQIAGIASPAIYTKGIELAESAETDDVVVEAINEAAPAILALHLGHPKQEIWFERVRDRLKVPLVIGVGGAFETILGKSNKQSPPGLPLEKIKQKIVSFLHYCFWIPPLLLYNTCNHLIHSQLFGRKQNTPSPRLFLSQKESLFVIPFPRIVNRETWESQLKSLDEALEHENMVLDFGLVRHMTPLGMGLLHAIWKKMRDSNKNFFLMRINGDLSGLLKLSGAWDMVKDYVVEGPDEVLRRLSINTQDNLLKKRVFLSLDQVEDQSKVSFFGRIHGHQVEEETGFQLEPIVSGRNLVMDLTYCTAIDNLGFGFLLHLREVQKKQKQSMVIENMSRFVKKQFAYYQVDPYFVIKK